MYIWRNICPTWETIFYLLFQITEKLYHRPSGMSVCSLPVVYLSPKHLFMFFLSRYSIIYCVIVHSETSHFSHTTTEVIIFFTTIISNPGVQLVKKERISKRRDGSGRVKNRGRLKSGLKSHASFSSATRHQPPSLTLLPGDQFFLFPKPPFKSNSIKI